MRRSPAARALLLAALGALLAPATARAGLAACKKAYEDQRYDEVVKPCDAVARDPLATRAEVTAAYEVIGMAQLVLGHERPARAAFCQTLAVDPDYRPTDPIYPQRFVAVFDATRAAGCGPTLRLAVDDASRRGHVAVRVRARGPLPAVSRFGVFYRQVGSQAGEGRWRRELAATGPAVTVELPGVSLAAGEVEVFAAVMIDDDTAVARAGFVDRPLRLARLAAEPERPARPGPGGAPVWRRPWFWWTVAGVAAAVLVISVTAGVASSSGPHGSLGSIHLPLRLTWR